MNTSPDAQLASTPTLGAVTGAALADRLARAYAGRLAPAFVRRVLRDEQQRDPTRPDDVIERAVRRRLDAWLALGRYPLADDREENYPHMTSGSFPGPRARLVLSP